VCSLARPDVVERLFDFVCIPCPDDADPKRKYRFVKILVNFHEFSWVKFFGERFSRRSSVPVGRSSKKKTTTRRNPLKTCRLSVANGSIFILLENSPWNSILILSTKRSEIHFFGCNGSFFFSFLSCTTNYRPRVSLSNRSPIFLHPHVPNR
jgi:hypothetical protein